MKQKLFTSPLLVLSSVLFLSLGSCITEPKPEPEKPQITSEEISQTQIALVVEQSAKLSSYKMMKRISPQTGDDPKYVYDVDEVKYDKMTQQASVELRVSWTARATQLSEKRRTCEMTGTLHVNFVNRKSGVVSAIFVPSSCNPFTLECAASYAMDEAAVLKAITFDPYK